MNFVNVTGFNKNIKIKKLLEARNIQLTLASSQEITFFLTFFYFLKFMIVTEREREREAETQGAILETRDRIPHRAPGAWSLLLPLPMSLPLSLSLSLCDYHKF